jgi:Cu+-exporting ATPase
VAPPPGFAEDELLRLVASAERGSEHPLGEAVVRGARARGLALADASGSTPSPATASRRRWTAARC